MQPLTRRAGRTAFRATLVLAVLAAAPGVARAQIGET